MSNPRSPVLLALLLGASSGLWGESSLESAARLIKAKHFQEAQGILDRSLQSDPRNAEAWYQLGRVHMMTNQAQRALECADKAIQIQPDQANYHVLRGNALGRLASSANMFKALGFAKDGLGSLEKAVQLEPGNRTAVSALFNWYANAPSLGGGSLDKAKALAEQSSKLDPGLSHYLKGMLLQKRKDPGAAQAEYRLAVSADPKFPEAYNRLGYVELEMKQVDLALDHFRKLVELEPDNAGYHDSLGDGWMAKGRWDEAIATYRKALALDPVLFESLRSLGKALEQAGRRDEAIQHYRQCAQTGAQKGIPALTKAAQERLKALGAS